MKLSNETNAEQSDRLSLCSGIKVDDEPRTDELEKRLWHSSFFSSCSLPTSSRLEETQRFLYMFLERPTGIRCFVYNVLVLIVIMCSLMFTWLCSIPSLDLTLQPYTSLIDAVMMAFFGVEYILRIWSSGCRHKYSGCRGRFRFMSKPLCLLDLLAVISLVGCLIYPSSTGISSIIYLEKEK